MEPDTVKPDIEHIPRADAAKKLLHRFYPVHYVVGMKVEDTLRTNDLLNRHQVAVLWIPLYRLFLASTRIFCGSWRSCSSSQST